MSAAVITACGYYLAGNFGSPNDPDDDPGDDMWVLALLLVCTVFAVGIMFFFLGV